MITTIVLIKADPKQIPETAMQLAGIAGVQEVYSVSGEWDLVAIVRVPDLERIAGIVANWPGGASAARAARLGLKPHENFAEIVQQYIADCQALPTAAQTLKGMQ